VSTDLEKIPNFIMIREQKCIEFNKYLDKCKKKTHMSFHEFNVFISVTSEHYSSLNPNSKHMYQEWQNEHEVSDETLNKTIETTVHNKSVFIDCSLNTVSDLVKIVEQYKLEDKTNYNIDLKMLYSINKELRQLDEMVGMKSLKKNVVDQLLYYMQDFHKNVDDYKHTVIYGPPGTGKTEVAKLLGNIYSKIGVIKKPSPTTCCDLTAVFKKATRSDMIAGFVGQTAIKTKALVTSCLGGVLFIDEAYSLGDDSFSKECVDTLCESMSDQKDNIMVIIAGYENELNERFFALNAGLESRFAWRFQIDNYIHTELWEIFKKKVADCKWEMAKFDGDLWFKKNFTHFSAFGRDVETLLFKTKIAHSKRVYGKNDCEKRKIELTDLDGGLKMFLDNKKKTPKFISSMFL
jgi:SpoVK/Ycf46/Vps4 family AAA+-type ATPase